MAQHRYVPPCQNSEKLIFQSDIYILYCIWYISNNIPHPKINTLTDLIITIFQSLLNVILPVKLVSYVIIWNCFPVCSLTCTSIYV